MNEKSNTEKKNKWVVLPFLWKGLKGLCMGLGAMVLFSLIISTYSAIVLIQGTEEALPDDMVLYVEFDGDLQELPGSTHRPWHDRPTPTFTFTCDF